MSMTTELAQRMKAAAIRAKAATEDFVANRMSMSVCLSECEEFNNLSDGPDNIIALVEALEKVQTERDEFRNRLKLERGILADADKRIAELEEAQSLHDEGASMLCGQYDELAAAMGWTSELAEKQGVSQLEYARWLNVRIAELETYSKTTLEFREAALNENRHLKLELEIAEKRIAELEARTVKLPPTFWYEHDDLSRDIPVLDKRLVKKAIRAAGVAVKGE